ncbi:ankyrin repeat-containing domain protein [Baffinella frigidus]|nr:ankyrin repeat-containing domain protein [Cryptophyta sp. CCMP2293]
MLSLFSLKSSAVTSGSSSGLGDGTDEARGGATGQQEAGADACLVCGASGCTSCMAATRRPAAAYPPAAVARRAPRRPVASFGGAHGGECACCAKPQPMQQSLDEMDFERSLCGAAARGDIDRVTHLLQSRSADPNQADAYGSFPLHYAARQGHAALCSALLSAGAAVDACAGEARSSPLHRAVLSGCRATVKVLLDAGADPLQADAEGIDCVGKAEESSAAGEMRDILHQHLERTPPPRGALQGYLAHENPPPP